MTCTMNPPVPPATHNPHGVLAACLKKIKVTLTKSNSLAVGASSQELVRYPYAIKHVRFYFCLYHHKKWKNWATFFLYFDNEKSFYRKSN